MSWGGYSEGLTFWLMTCWPGDLECPEEADAAKDGHPQRWHQLLIHQHELQDRADHHEEVEPGHIFAKKISITSTKSRVELISTKKSNLNTYSLNTFLFIRGLSCTSSVQTSLTQNCHKLTIPGFPYTVFLYLVMTLSLKKIICLVKAWKSGLKVPLLLLGPSCPLQTILLSDLVGCDSPLQIVMVIWRFFF